MQSTNSKTKVSTLNRKYSDKCNKALHREISSPLNLSIPKSSSKRPSTASESPATANVIDLIRKLNSQPASSESDLKTMTSGEYRQFLYTQSKNIINSSKNSTSQVPIRRASLARTTPPTTLMKHEERNITRHNTLLPSGKPPSGRKPLKEEHKVELPAKSPLGIKNISAILHGKESNLSPEKEKHKGKIEDYKVDKQIGQGAYAIVRHATHIATSKKVAFKTYEKIKLLDPNRKKNVMREIDILGMLDHKNIVKLYETIDTARQLHIVMEYISGCSLHGYLKRKPNRRIEENDAKRIVKQILCAMEYCHAKNVTHRDLKLENLLLDEKNDVKIIDFGFATCFSSEKKVKIFCGTPSYMAPEIVARKEYAGPPVDVWAIGVLIFVLLCGHYPFKGNGDKELYRKIQQGYFMIPQHVSLSAKSLISRILKVDPTKRPKVSEILQDPWFSSPSNFTVSTEDSLLATTNNHACSINGDTLDFDVTCSIKKLEYSQSPSHTLPHKEIHKFLVSFPQSHN
ncbi:unnamed protein product [Blepharisma stoltei]|uniref:Protein kinase domain-containing protein n=1 Tax=Blepharisma stoltei TaxID=1481888 RepID=A0AAU9JPK1_9CILI|nr:unnamed protein product [Blepharisma stoltei]